MENAHDLSAAEPPKPPARDGSVGVYAAVAAFAAAVPLPFVDALLSEAARGSAMRRVAARHGVRLTREARRALSTPGKLETGRSVRVIRSVMSRVIAPIRMANRLEDGLAAFVSASLLDHYLSTSDRRRGMPMAEAEAARVRRAMDAAAVEGALGSLRRTPEGAWAVLTDAFSAFRGEDLEDRTPVERVFDAILDVLADGPEGVVAEYQARFDAALERQPLEFLR